SSAILFSMQTKSYQTSCCTWIRGRVTRGVSIRAYVVFRTGTSQIKVRPVRTGGRPLDNSAIHKYRKSNDRRPPIF
ncbi:hypothetical protein, partial [Burkholderia ubonensis]|uniref:hypothetical protein n=1 Tax=Burkholderia ubonensis TaxID=101571 RepID=UPI001E5C2AFF